MFAPDPTGAPTASADPTSSAAPVHTSAGVTCRPATSTFTWDDPAPVVGYEAVSVHTASFGKNESGIAFDAVDPDLAFSGDESSPAMVQVLADFDRWTPVLAKSLLASTSAPDDLGQVSAIFDDSEFVPPQPHTGTWVRAVVASTDSYRFTLTCQDGTTADGTLFGGADPSTATTIVLHCDSKKKHPKDSPQQAAARAECTFAHASGG
jgi:hypothetical protein